jgi:hypothetical protein
MNEIVVQAAVLLSSLQSYAPGICFPCNIAYLFFLP